jgi:acetylornithine/N-succinyldiaminopimelate aminotransferase
MSTAALVNTYTQLPLTLVSGCGSRVVDTGGREYWDFYGGHAVALLGQSHPAVARALSTQAAKLSFYSNVVPLAIRTAAAERLAGFAPPGLGRVFLCNSGSEANENALKLALQRTGRRQIAALHGAFHGRTLLALAATANENLRRPFDGLLCPTVRLRANQLEDLALINARTAAVIVEPIQSLAGVVELSAEYRRALRARCDAVGALLVYDEVQTGVGRLGRPFAAGADDVLPDLLTLAKGMANGVPMGAVLMTDRVAERVRLDDLGATFGGGPLACAALLAVLDTIERENLVTHAARLGEEMHRQLRVGPVQAVLGRGCLIGLRVHGQAKRLQTQLLERGFITGTSGDAAVLRLLPALNMPVQAIADLSAALAALGD